MSSTAITPDSVPSLGPSEIQTWPRRSDLVSLLLWLGSVPREHRTFPTAGTKGRP